MVENDPIHVGPHTFGERQGCVMPFEDATVDYGMVNEIRKRDPTYGHNVVPDAMVRSCSQCCMETVNGKPNTLGAMWRKRMTVTFPDGRKQVDCSHCHVGKSGDFVQARDGHGNKLAHKDGSVITQTELTLMEMDGQD